MKSFNFSLMSPQEINQTLKDYQIALTASEALKIQELLNRPVTLAECILWGIQGSEHCSYKSTRKHLKKLCTDGPNVISGAKEDAGVVEIASDHAGYKYCIVMSHESHNHPSQVVPFEGAATGVGGNVRDVSCMGSEVIANADILRFGDYNSYKARWLSEEVVAGIASYSNAIGVPNIAGDVYFDAGYNDNCLVSVVSLGILRADHLIHSYAPANSTGHDLILVGKPTDASGFGGASFASVALDEEDQDNNRSAVQEPNSFLGRMLLQSNLALFKKFQELNVIDQVGFKDLGAGGIACASVELSEHFNLGAQVYLEHVHVSKKNLDPAIILCSETQERYMWVVPPEITPMVLAHYNETWQLPYISSGACATVIGKIRADGDYHVYYQDTMLVSAKAKDITKGIMYDREFAAPKHHIAELPTVKTQKIDDAFIYQKYDKQVQGRTIVERGAADAGVLQPFNSDDYPAEIRNIGVALAVAANPSYGKIDPFWTAAHAVISSVCKVVAVGATPWALTDCLCFGNPEHQEQMWQLVTAIEGLNFASKNIGLLDFENAPIPIIAGNVSLYNNNKIDTAIPASPLVSCLGRLEDINQVLKPKPDIEKSCQDYSFINLIFINDPNAPNTVNNLNISTSINNIPKPNLKILRQLLQKIISLNKQKLLLSLRYIENGFYMAVNNESIKDVTEQLTSLATITITQQEPEVA